MIQYLHMENPIEDLSEREHRFGIRQKIQSRIICDYYGVRDNSDVSNEQASSWIKSNSASFSESFIKTTEEYPSFWDDADRDFDGAVELVKQKLSEQNVGHQV